jgi:hypothetical protein
MRAGLVATSRRTAPKLIVTKGRKRPGVPVPRCAHKIPSGLSPGRLHPASGQTRLAHRPRGAHTGCRQPTRARWVRSLGLPAQSAWRNP